MKIIIQIIVFAVIGIGLNITNPSKNEFIDYASTQIKKKHPEIDLRPLDIERRSDADG